MSHRAAISAIQPNTARRTLIAGAAAGLALTAPWVRSQDGAGRPVRVMVPWPAGHTADIVGRLLATRLHARGGPSFYVDNVGGAAGVIGTTQFTKAANDGQTLMVTSGGPIVLAPLFNKALGYDTQRDLAPIALLGWFGSVLVTRPDLAAKDLPDLIEMARKQPGKLSFSSTGNTSFNRLQMELLMRSAGLQLVHVPFRGEADQLNALMGGAVDIGFSGIAASAPLVQSGRLKGLAVGMSTRSPLLPHTPTFGEAGVPVLRALSDSGVRTWVGVFAPARTPETIIARLSADIAALLDQPDFRQQLLAQGLTPATPGSPQAFADVIQDNTRTWRRIVDEARITAE